MASLAGFDANEVPEDEGFRALPKGAYPAIAVESEMKPTKKGTGEYLQFTFEILDGKGKGRKVWARMNIKNPNSTAQDIGQRELAQFCKAVAVNRPNDSAELHNLPVLLHLDTEIDDRDREVNVIKKYEAIGGAQTQQQQPRAFGSARDAARDTANSYSPPARQEAAAGGKPAGASPWQR
jgi:hypothetical protein